MDLNELLNIDEKLIEEERKKLKLPNPYEFEEGRITQDIIEKLLKLVKIDFDKKCIIDNEEVDYYLKLNRLYYIFGRTHIKIDYEIVKTDIKEIDSNKFYEYIVKVRIKIGNYTLYFDKEGIPESKFITLYEIEDIGKSEEDDEILALDKAVRKGFNRCLRNLGIFYNDNKENKTTNKEKEIDDDTNYTEIQLIENPKLNVTNNTFLKAKALDLKFKKVVEIVIFYKNKNNQKKHNEMIKYIKDNRNIFTKDKVLKIRYQVGNWDNTEHYIIKNISL